MSELKIFYKDKNNDKIKVGRSVNILNSLDKSDIIWIDLLDVSDKTEGVLEDFLKKLRELEFPQDTYYVINGEKTYI